MIRKGRKLGRRLLAALRRRARRIPYARRLRATVHGLREQRRQGRILREGGVAFRCNICGAASAAPVAQMGRETPSCGGCGSTVRMRAVVHCLSQALWGRSLALEEFPERKEVRGIGLSDWVEYADRLAKRLDYANTFLDREPRLDILRVPPELVGRMDFVISSDVFEHVPPPVGRAFRNTLRLLKPGGTLILTVPYLRSETDETVEHFPELDDFWFEKTASGQRLHNRTADGREQVFEDLVFHGGEGLTLEMRVFTTKGLMDELHQAGFAEAHFVEEGYAPWGIQWSGDAGRPIVARRPEAGETMGGGTAGAGAEDRREGEVRMEAVGFAGRDGGSADGERP